MTARRFKSNETVDFIVVGSGAAGGVLARELSTAGFSVLVFEQGPRFTPADFEHDELKYFFLSGITVDPKISPQSFRRSEDTPAKPAHGIQPALYARLVGGSSNHFTANYWRFHEIDFNERSVVGSIPGTGFADWPITYQELEPYYTKVEWEIGVSGLAYASPFDPPRTKPYPMPPLAGEVFRRAARARRPKIGAAPLSGPDGDCVTAVSRPSRLHTLRILHGLRLRGAREVLLPVHHDSRSRGDRALRSARRQLCVSRGYRFERPRHRCALFRWRQARTLPEGRGR